MLSLQVVAVKGICARLAKEKDAKKWKELAGELATWLKRVLEQDVEAC